MKIFLLNPATLDHKAFIREGRCTQEQGVWTTVWPPVSLAMMAAVLEQDGSSVRILDASAEGLRMEDVFQEVREYQPDFIVWTTATPTIESDLSLAARFKEMDPHLKTAVLGTHVSALAEDVLKKTKDLDFIIRNEPEMTIRDIVRSLEKNLPPGNVTGLSYRKISNEILHNPDRPFIHEMDDLPYPAWHLVNTSCYRLPIKNEKFLIVAPFRGCPHKCTFCSCQEYYGYKVRKRSMGHLINEFKRDIKEFGVRNFFMWAETFTIDRKYVQEICQAIIDSGLDIAWTCNSRVDTADPELLRLMRKAGCWMISFGIETGNQEVLDQTLKRTKVEEAEAAVNNAHKAGIKVVGHFILGLPGETRQSMQETVDLALRLNVDLAQFYCAAPIPGTSLYQMAVANGWIHKDIPWDQFRQDTAIMKLPNLPPEEVTRFRKYASRKFYFRLTTVLKIVQLAGPAHLADLVRPAVKFLRYHP